MSSSYSRKAAVVFLPTVLALAIWSFAQKTSAPDRLTSAIDASKVVPLRGNVHPKAQSQYDQGAVEPAFELSYITLALKPSAKQQAALDRLLAEQQDPSSPNYHHWLTPEQFADRFGVSQNDLSKIAAWLQGGGFTVVKRARGRNWIAFRGTAAQVQQAFHTEIHHYQVAGELHFANATEPSIPAALRGMVAGIRGLNDFKPKAMHHPSPNPLPVPNPHSMNLPRAVPDYTASGFHFLAPGDIATIYDIAPLLNSAVDGTGQSLVIVGQSDITASDIQQFRQGFSLPTINLTQVVVGTDPGHTGDEGEADLDIEWAGAVARKAAIIYEIAANAFDAAQDAINMNRAPVISMSFGGCEPINAGGGIASFELILKQASTQGITFLASSGDSGAAGCDGNVPAATQGLAVNYPASSPEVTGVGGSTFNEGTGNYWSGTNSSDGGSALSYIPETSWNDTTLAGTLTATGGGRSSCIAKSGANCTGGFPKPSWQTGPGVPADGVRDVPDVTIAASPNHDGYILCTKGSCASGIPTAVQNNSIVGGTSASAPVLAGIVVLLNQYAVSKGLSAGQGNVNPKLYTLAQGSSAASLFHDITSGNNIVPCQQGTTGCPTTAPFQYGFGAGAGYDLVTGLGSVDANALVTGWLGGTSTTTTLTVSAAQINAGTSVTFTANVSATSGSPTGSVTFFNGSTQLGTGTLSSGTATFTSSTLVGGSYSVTATYGGDATFAPSTSAAVALAVQDFSITPSPTSLTIVRGKTGSVTFAVSSTPATFSPAVSFSCLGLPTESTCAFNPATVTPSSGSGSTTLTITTTAPSGALRNPFERSRPLFYALFVPGLFGIVTLARKGGSPRRGLRALGLVSVLVLSLWWTACGGGSSSNKNPGSQPVGASTVTVTATASGLSHTSTLTVTLQ